ncbi:hypothetical protein [Streptomyces collinus]|uniref:hypothetical protein n=1 Tax=Streptomyces collinus TaxID=42684 RepID=UPI0029422EA1|nr:hypothetical protein [Streptomyces collinus]
MCLGAALAACGAGAGDGGYTAVGGLPRQTDAAGTPTGAVRMVPLDGPGGGTGPTGTAPGGGTRPAASSAPPATTAAPPDRPGRPGPTGSGHAGPATAAPSTTGRGTTAPSRPAPGPTSSRTTSPAPADLTWGAAARADTDRRWCEKVTVPFRNSGGTPVRSGTVTFGTHIIGALGVDWGTVESTAALPVPLGPGARTDHTWTVCVDAWRVPLGMHIETRDVSVRWE